MSDTTTPANYQTQFVVGPMTGAGGNLTVQGRQFLLALWNRTGGAPGYDISFEVTQINIALSTAQEAEVDAQKGISAAATAQGTASQALTTANQAQTTADQAEKDAQTAISDAQDVLQTSLLTSALNKARADISISNAGALAMARTIWPSQTSVFNQV